MASTTTQRHSSLPPVPKDLLTGTNLDDTEQAILTPILFFDLFDRPVRRSTLHALAYGQQLDRSLFDHTVDDLEAKGLVKQRRDFVCLEARDGLMEVGEVREEYSEELWKEARALITELATVPFIRMIAVINSLSFWNARPDSDIDILVVTEPGKIAIARDHINLWITLRGKRNTRGPKRGKLAPDIFLDTDALAVNDFHLVPRDVYLDFWFARITPVINREQTYERLLAANPWVTERFPQFTPRLQHIIKTPDAYERRRMLWERFYTSPIGSWLGGRMIAAQRNRLLHYQHQVGNGGLVLVSPHQLRFHVPDRRAEYQQQFEARWDHLVHLFS